jgi:hypothetical protein
VWQRNVTSAITGSTEGKSQLALMYVLVGVFISVKLENSSIGLGISAGYARQNKDETTSDL